MQTVVAMDVEPISELLDEINNDRRVPRNIRNVVTEAKKILSDKKTEPAVRINAAISGLEEISVDPNIPIYTRTQIWNILYMLEVLNEKLKV